MCILLIRSESGRMQITACGYLAQNHHIRIIPMAGTSIGRPIINNKGRSIEAGPAIPDIRPGSVGIGQPGPICSIFNGCRIGKTVYNIPAALTQCFGHANGRRHGNMPVVFKIVHPPFGKLLCIISIKLIFAYPMILPFVNTN